MKFNLELLSNKTEKGNLLVLKKYRFPNGRMFPDSYINFVNEYGYGLSANMFIIYIPLEDSDDSFFIRSQEIIATYQEVLNDESELWFDLLPDMSFSLLKDLVPFAMSENGHYLFWNTQSKSSDEFDIYLTDFRGTGFIRVASNLYDFFAKVTSVSSYKEVLPFQTKVLPKTFMPLPYPNQLSYPSIG